MTLKKKKILKMLLEKENTKDMGEWQFRNKMVCRMDTWSTTTNTLSHPPYSSEWAYMCGRMSDTIFGGSNGEGEEWDAREPRATVTWIQ